MHKGRTAVVRLVFFILCLLLSALQTDCSLTLLLSRGRNFFTMLGEMFPPEGAFFKDVAGPVWETLRISLLGTFFGALSGAAGAFFCNSYVNRRKRVRVFLKAGVHLVRCIPVLILALLCTFFLGIGPLAGIVAITVSTGAVLARLGYEDSENADLRAAYALEAMGPGRLKAYAASVWRQILPGYINNVLYLLEANVRNAAVLGFVGAGGIGLLLNEKLAWREYGRAGTVLCALFILVLFTEYLSELLRKELQERNGRIRQGITVSFCVLLLLSFFLTSWSLPEGINTGAALSVVRGILLPDTGMLFSLKPGDVPFLLWETLCISFLGTAGGAVIAFLFSLFSSFRFFGIPALLPRVLLLGIRSVPVLVYGLLWIRVTGPGAFAGVLTLVLCSVGLLAKRFLTAADSIDMNPYYALRAAGNGFLPAFCRSVIPQLMPHYVTAVLYRLDINLREAAALGLVGAGGIGTPLFLAMNHYEWEQAGALLWGMVILVSAAGFFSETYRAEYRLKK